MSSDRLAVQVLHHAAHIGEMTPPLSIVHHRRLNGTCPDGQRCRLPVHCSEQCSRLEREAIAETLRAQAAIAAGRQPDIDRTHEEGEPMDPPTKDAMPTPEPIAADPPPVICKIPGCEKPAVSAMGRYAKLCLEHRNTPVATTSMKRRQMRKRASTNGHAKLTPTGLVKLARDLVTVSDDLAELEAQVEAKRSERDRITARLAKAAAKS